MVILGGWVFLMSEVPLWCFLLTDLQTAPSTTLKQPTKVVPGSLRALPIETKVESGTSQSKSGTSVNLSSSRLFHHFRARTGGEAHRAGVSSWFMANLLATRPQSGRELARAHALSLSISISISDSISLSRSLLLFFITLEPRVE